MAEVYHGKTVLSRGVSARVKQCGDGLNVGMEGGGVDRAGLSPRRLTFLWERRIGLSQPAFRCPDLALAAWPWEAISCAGREAGEVKQVWTLR